MIRAFGTALLCAVAIIAGDTLFRASLLRQLRPVIVWPVGQAVVDPPVEVRWEGPRLMRVFLSAAGEEPRDLGGHESPLVVDAAEFPRDGGYRVDIQALRLGDWVQATRWFQVHAAVVKPARDEQTAPAPAGLDLLRALEAARAARDKAQGRSKFLRQENAALRDESQRLATQLEAVYESRDEDAERTAQLERRLAQLAEENRALGEENAAVRQRLASVIPCTVWGYFSFPRPQTIPVTRRVLMVSDMRGRVFRAQIECETVRHDDVTAASTCFCVGSSWGG